MFWRMLFLSIEVSNFSISGCNEVTGGTTLVTNNGVVFIAYERTGNSQEVPEPSTLAIFALGIMGLAARRFKKQA